MTSTAGPVPTTAERIRSVWMRAQSLLAIDGTEPGAEPGAHPGAESAAAPATGPATEPVPVPLCHLLDDGTVAIAGARLAADGGQAGVPALLELTDHSPLPLRERVRALVWVRGRLHPVPPAEVEALLDRIAAEDPNPALLQVQSPRSQGGGVEEDRYPLLRLTMESVVVADTTGAEAVPVADLLAAEPDPFCVIEATWLRHLQVAHPEVITRLATRLPPQLRRGQIHPLGIDRYGIWLRVEGGDGDRDVRLPFHAPAHSVTALNRAVRVLMGCPFRNGLHARRP